jgi:hypothetical protein
MSESIAPMLSQPELSNAPMLGGLGVGRIPARSYNEAAAYLNRRADRPYRPIFVRSWDGKEYRTTPRATRVQRRDGIGVAVKYHDTDVITYTEAGIVLNNGGYFSITTKDRINDALGVLPGNPYVYADRRRWYLRTDRGGENDSVVFYYDGITVGYDGKLVNHDPIKAAQIAENMRELDRVVDSYFAAFKTQHESGEYFDGAQSECSECYNFYLFGDVQPDRDHVLEHMRNGELIGAILTEALTRVAYSRADMEALIGSGLGRQWGTYFLYRRMKRGLRVLVGLPR